MLRSVTLLLLFFAATQAQAQTAYVADGVPAQLFAEKDELSLLLKTLEPGEKLEVLELSDGFVQVRSRSGETGWVLESVLSAQRPVQQQPPRQQPTRSQVELAKLKQELQSTRQKLDMVKLDLEQERLVSADLAARLKQQSEAAPEATEQDSAKGAEFSGFHVNLIWLGVSFAMLLIGFGAGVIWLREQNRRKLGGRYLRV